MCSAWTLTTLPPTTRPPLSNPSTLLPITLDGSNCSNQYAGSASTPTFGQHRSCLRFQ
ncbi:hypothetical protein J6590_038769 [Homalodisca vitripennis]|nr:hypothetical protein J6590_038769 [Homalodisca vitripennis]